MIDPGMRARIQAAIAKAEQGTRAEFVAAVARRADEYRGNALMAAFIAAILAGVAVWIFAPWPGPGETLVADDRPPLEGRPGRRAQVDRISP